MTAAELHAQIMNLQANVVSPSSTKRRVFKSGHAQARLAAAALAQEAYAALEAEHAKLRAAITKASEAWAHAKASTAGTDVVVNSQEAVLIDAALSPQEPKP